MRTFLPWLLLTLLACPGLAAGLTLGVAPHTSARVILEMYQPLRRHLEQELGQPVEVVTAPDFTEFASRALAGAYDLAVTTGHQARLLQTDAGYLPLLTYKADFKAVVLTARASGIRAPRDLDGQVVLGLSPSSLVTLWGEQWLADRRVRGAQVRYVSASDSVAHLLVAGEAKAAFTSLANFQKLPDKLQADLRVLAASPAMAGRVYLLHPRLRDRLKAVQAALAAFAASPAGRTYFQDNKLEGYRPLRPGELATMDRYAARTREQVRKAAP